MVVTILLAIPYFASLAVGVGCLIIKKIASISRSIFPNTCKRCGKRFGGNAVKVSFGEEKFNYTSCVYYRAVEYTVHCPHCNNLMIIKDCVEGKHGVSRAAVQIAAGKRFNVNQFEVDVDLTDKHAIGASAEENAIDKIIDPYKNS